MKRTVIFCAMIFTMNTFAQCVDEINFANDLRATIRGTFGVPAERNVIMTNDLKKVRAGTEKSIIYVEQLSEDRIFDRPRPPKAGKCPDHIIRLFQVWDQDEFRKCNIILQSDARSLIHNILYRHCSVN